MKDELYIMGEVPNSKEYIFMDEKNDKFKPWKRVIEFYKLFNLDNKKVLDIGCNTGHTTSLIYSAYKNIEVVGIDKYPHVIKTAKENFEKPGLTFIHINAADYKPNFKFDCILILAVYNTEHFFDLLLEEIINMADHFIIETQLEFENTGLLTKYNLSIDKLFRGMYHRTMYLRKNSTNESLLR